MPRPRRRPPVAGRRAAGGTDPGVCHGDGLGRGGDHRRPAAGRRARAPGGAARPARPGGRLPHRHARLPPRRGQVAPDHRTGPAGRIFGGGRKRVVPLPQDRRAGPVCYSTLVDPAPAAAEVLPGHSLRLGSRAADFLQLAHYHRMLQACGFAAHSSPWRGDRQRRPVAHPGAGLGRPGPPVGADVLPQPPGRLAVAQPAGALRLRAGVPGLDRRGGAAADRRSGDRPAAAGPPDREPRVRPLPLVGALPAPAQPRGRQPADRQGRAGLARDRHACGATASPPSPTWPGWTWTRC